MLEIKKFKDLIEPVLLNDGKEYVGINVSNLTSIGDNYASLMLSIEITTRNKKNEAEEVHAVAKMFPPNELLRKIYNTPIQFRNELGFYTSIAPAIKEFQRRQEFSKIFNAHPQFIAGRTSLNNDSAEINDDAVIVLSNIKYENYVNIDKAVGFNLETSKLILKKIAEFHATTFAMRKLAPELFEKNISPYIVEVEMFKFDGKEASHDLMSSLFNPIKDDEELVLVLKNTFQAMRENLELMVKNSSKFAQGKFTTLIHHDLWINNIMVKFLDDEPVDVKFVDYQLIENNSAVCDLILFLSTSVEINVLKENFDYLIQFYYDNLMEFLDKLDYKDVEELTFENLEEEISLKLKEKELFHIILMLGPVFATKENTKSLDKMELVDLTHKKEVVLEEHKERSSYLIREFLRRKWI